MNVHDLQIALRPRTGWEAVDLGFHLTRSYYQDLLKIGFIAFFPFCLLVICLLWKFPFLSLFIIWWLKPIYDRFYLHYFSRRIFGSEITVKEVLKKAPYFLFKGSFPMLTWCRLSPWRSMTLPIRDLEQLKGRQLGKRADVVRRIGGGKAVNTTLTLRACEILIFLAFYSLIVSFIPQGNWAEVDGYLERLLSDDEAALLLGRVSTIVFACITLFIEPFYVGAGFSLYLNSRCNQEAWDIELRFKEYASRLSKSMLKVASILLVGLLLLYPAVTPLSAEESPAEAVTPAQVQAEVDNVFAHEDFKIHKKKIKRWVPDEGSMTWLEDFFEWLFSRAGDGDSPNIGVMEGLLKLLAIIVISALVLALAFVLAKVVRERAMGVALKDVSLKKERPETVLGMEISKESLPMDLIGEARAAWQAGDYKRALSFLYRGALSKVIIDYDAEILSSDTEYECLKASKKVLSPHLSAYFKTLTRHWITVAYSKERVSEADFNNLCETWAFKES